MLNIWYSVAIELQKAFLLHETREYKVMSIFFCKGIIGKEQRKRFKELKAYLQSVVDLASHSSDFICMRMSHFIDTLVLCKTRVARPFNWWSFVWAAFLSLSSHLHNKILVLQCSMQKFPEMNSMKSLLNRTQFEAHIELADTKLTFFFVEQTASWGERESLWSVWNWLECGKSSSALKLFVWDFGSARVPADLYVTLSMSVPRDYCAIVVCHTTLTLSFAQNMVAWRLLWSRHLRVESVQGQPQDPQLGVGIERASMSLSEWVDIATDSH